MTEILKIFLMDIIGEAETLFDFGIVSMTNMVFRLESAIQSAVGVSIFDINKILAVTYSLGLSLLILKCLKKGFEQYVLWTDGDADTPPMEMLVKIAKAIAIAAGFPVLYDYLVDIVNGVTDLLLKAVPFALDWDSITIHEILTWSVIDADIGATLIKVLLTFVYLILLCVMMYQFIKKGVEMLVLRMGVPIGVIGYLDSDQGISKGYFKVFFQCAFTIIIQTVTLKISISIWLASSNMPAMLFAIMFMAFSAGTSKFLSQFLLQAGGGGGGAISSVYYASSAISRMASLLRK